MDSLAIPSNARFSPTLRFNGGAAAKAFPGQHNWFDNSAGADALRKADGNYWGGLSRGLGAGGGIGAGLGGLLGLFAGHPIKGALIGGLLGAGLGGWQGHTFGKSDASNALQAGTAAANALAK